MSTLNLQRRHFEFIAKELIAPLGTPQGPLGALNMTPDTKASIARFIGGQLRRTSPRFNLDRFVQACGVEE